MKMLRLIFVISLAIGIVSSSVVRKESKDHRVEKRGLNIEASCRCDGDGENANDFTGITFVGRCDCGWTKCKPHYTWLANCCKKDKKDPPAAEPDN